MIGSGIETVLQLEGRYEVRRAVRLADGVASAQGWPADVVLVDAVLLGAEPADFGAPTYVLAGDPGQGEVLAATLPGARGWLPKDLPPSQLLEAVDAATGVVRVDGDVRGTLGLLVAVLVGLLFLAAIALAMWRFVLGG